MRYPRNQLADINFQVVRCAAPFFYMQPRDERLRKEFEQGFDVERLFVRKSMGVTTARDGFVVDMSAHALRERYVDLLDGANSDAELVAKYGLKNTSSFNLSQSRSVLSDVPFESVVQEEAYRPFDSRYIVYTASLVERPLLAVMGHMLRGPNLALISCKSNRDESHTYFIANGIADKSLASSLDNAYVFPLFLYPDATAQTSTEGQGVRPNLNADVVNQLAESVGLKYSLVSDASTDRAHLTHGMGAEMRPLDVLDYIYGVLHSPTYRERYREFLQSGFPRIPFPDDANKFRALVKLGAELRALHLLDGPGIDTYITSYPVGGSNEVTRKMSVNSPGWESTSEALGRVWINDTQYFDRVPEVAWNFYIGGYQPAQKWLKDRHGRTLGFSDIRHYQRMIVALKRTAEVMEEVDRVGVL